MARVCFVARVPRCPCERVPHRLAAAVIPPATHECLETADQGASGERASLTFRIAELLEHVPHIL
jgi:hypothetical protein